MRKKYLFFGFFFVSYLLLSFQPVVEAANAVMNTQENLESNHKESVRKNLNTKNAIDKLGPIQEFEETMDSDLDCTKDIPFTLAQKKRLDQIYHRIYMDYIDLIETYAWAGALTQDQKLIRYKMLKNYVLTFPKRNYKWCSEYEEDEWEEEWFNSDQD